MVTIPAKKIDSLVICIYAGDAKLYYDCRKTTKPQMLEVLVLLQLLEYLSHYTTLFLGELAYTVFPTKLWYQDTKSTMNAIVPHHAR